MMERFNPFANEDPDSDPFTTSFNRSTEILNKTNRPKKDADKTDKQADDTQEPDRSQITTNSRYTTSFPDPFGDSLPLSDPLEQSAKEVVATKGESRPEMTAKAASSAVIGGSRSNSVTFASPSSHSVDDIRPFDSSRRSVRQRTETGGFSSFLSRATSVTSSSVTDRVSGAVDSVRSAVDSLSSQIQQAVPSNVNERLASTASNLIGGDPTAQTQQQQPQQSAASYLASKLTSATGQFTSAGQSPNSMPVISRQRVVLILDSLAETDWALQFNNYRRTLAGLTPLNSGQSTLSSFFSQATAQLSSSSSANLDGGDLIEQVDFRTVSVLANQSTSTATVFVAPTHQTSLQQQHQLQQQSQNQPLIRTNSQASKLHQQACRIIRPEYVVVRERSRDKQEDLRLIVNALNYCLVPMFEPVEVWNCFQDRQMLFSKLLRIQKHLGKEHFPLIPQVYCQTHQDLLNYLNGSTVHLPCLVRIGSTGQGKIRIDNQQMLKDFSTIMATSGLSCTVEPHLDVTHDLIIQKLGANLKSFKRKRQLSAQTGAQLDDSRKGLMSESSFGSPDSPQKQSAFRQTSLGTSVLSSLITSSGGQTPLARRSSSSCSANQGYEKMTELNVRHKTWLEAVEREFDNKIKAFCLKVVVANNDREYIVGMRNCNMDFLGTLDNQDEDKRSFVELITSHMNRNLPKHSSISRESSLNVTPQAGTGGTLDLTDSARRSLMGDQKTGPSKYSSEREETGGFLSTMADKKRFTSQTQINDDETRASGAGLGSRSKSVSMNQSDFPKAEQLVNKSHFNRRGSDQSDTSSTDPESASQSTIGGLHQRQSSLGQSFFDQTSTALSSFQKQSMSFFKRFDGQAFGSNTPPQSAKSDRGFLMSSPTGAAPMSPAADGSGRPLPTSGVAGFRANGFKSQSMDTPSLEHNYGKPSRRTPPKPPPPAPQSLVNRQSSLAASYGQSYRLQSTSATPNSTPAQTRQNSAVSEGTQQRNRVVRQNSALSAFEPFDQELSAAAAAAAAAAADETGSGLEKERSDSETKPGLDKAQRPSGMATRKTGNSDSVSVTSGDSTSTGETVTGEDTMNNLKKTFASIFGDKCE